MWRTREKLCRIAAAYPVRDGNNVDQNAQFFECIEVGSKLTVLYLMKYVHEVVIAERTTSLLNQIMTP